MLYFRTNVVAMGNIKLGLIRLGGQWPHKYWVFLIKIINNQIRGASINLSFTHRLPVCWLSWICAFAKAKKMSDFQSPRIKSNP
ncbi:MAG: hypothetical protein A2X75_01075 [Gallionellales bacterium GWE2_58_10]|nr:MAG: hypothetical protein A2X75_01075 [Gallionellales bacterium GWE2_58_10]OGT04750.1 MAG: hypothetical protein A2143_05330 [Gallionellales bacterium RBG_16_57_15]